MMLEMNTIINLSGLGMPCIASEHRAWIRSYNMAHRSRRSTDWASALTERLEVASRQAGSHADAPLIHVRKASLMKHWTLEIRAAFHQDIIGYYVMPTWSSVAPPNLTASDVTRRRAGTNLETSPHTTSPTRQHYHSCYHSCWRYRRRKYGQKQRETFHGHADPLLPSIRALQWHPLDYGTTLSVWSIHAIL